MAAADPYREWLKIQQPRRPLTHYELLRLRPLESDPRVIRAAADRQAQRLSRVDHDAAAKKVSQLLREVAAARDCLLDARQKAAYDAALRTASARLANNNRTQAADEAREAKPLLEDQPLAPLLPPRLGAASVATEETEGVARETPEAASQNAAAGEPESVAVASGISTHRRRVIAARKKGRSNWVWQAGALAVLAAAAAVGVIWWVTDGHQRLLGITPANENHAARPPVVDSNSPPRGRTVEDRNVESVVQTNDVRHAAPPDPVMESPDAVTDNPGSAVTTDSDAPPQPEDVAAVREALQAFQRALSQRDLTAAAAALNTAADRAEHPKLAEHVSQSRTLLHYVRGFWNAVEQSIATLKGGEELIWRNDRSIVVEAGAGRFILRVAGLNRTFQGEQLPADLAVLIAQRWLAADDPNSPVFTAAFLSVDPDGDRRRARSIFHTARAQGIEAADDLLAVLDTMPVRRGFEGGASDGTD